MSLQRLTESADGVFIISATPFTEQGELDMINTLSGIRSSTSAKVRLCCKAQYLARYE